MFDLIVRNGLWFDGTDCAPRRATLGIRDGRVAEVTFGALDETDCPEVIDAAGKWVLPGFIDIHTHYDAEVLLNPGLDESVRHGVTTIALGCCSMSSVYADSEDVADLFSRVEAVPRAHVLGALEQFRSWDGPDGYVKALDALPLGPNVTSFLGHSDLRTSVMGLGRATNTWSLPTPAELKTMSARLDEALDAGMLGLSGMDSPIDKLDGDRYRSRALPSTYAWWHERWLLIDVLRRHGRVLQSAPNIKNPLTAVLFFAASGSYRTRRKQVPISLLVVADGKSAPGAHLVLRGAAAVGNAVFGSRVKFQHLPVPFTLYSDGIDLPVFEEFGAGTAALHLRDQIQRNALMADKDYRRKFRREFMLKRHMPGMWHKDFHDARIVECPDSALVGKSFGQIADERGDQPLDVFLDVLVENGEKNVRWTTTVGNHRPGVLDRIARDRNVQMGFSDAGAHLRNMAFYNFGLRFLKRMRDAEAAGEPVLPLGTAVHRLTGELGTWFGLDAGFLRRGDRADFVVVDPEGLDEALAAYHEEPAEFFGGLSRMVNRNDTAVVATGIGGQVVFRDGTFIDGYGRTLQTGHYLKAGQKPAPTAAAVH
ncbi:amidohydrolase family protein [Mycolicibacillus parakoreensis]|uniref:Amidohydrolase family protein n=1 Tax=Mycolicibacillus parakoreensis TaxID=1069221 RepID=A0ABY3U4W5_9MYCO|nr:amidohydrolase family protein [Mycolicibacillus parakoreensis]MCV7317441.1 amidohydrolase family protein [Mycolicibacillus parakoreensis]ULN53939.1 amidohydrolase family protein [Mycolicibacillus parakoreensis]